MRHLPEEDRLPHLCLLLNALLGVQVAVSLARVVRLVEQLARRCKCGKMRHNERWWRWIEPHKARGGVR
eukprot:7139048-Prymnesium_polylepis.1